MSYANLSPEAITKIKAVFQDIDHLMSQVESLKDSIKDHITGLSDEYDLPKRTLNKMAKVYHAQNFMEEQQRNEEFELLYQNVVANSMSQKADNI